MSEQYESYADRWVRRYREEHGILEPTTRGVGSYEEVVLTGFSFVSENTAEQSKSLLYGVPEEQIAPFSGVDPIVTAAVKLRKELKLTQASFAKYLKLSPRTLSDWEQGRRRPSGAALTLLEWVVESPEFILSKQKKDREQAVLRRLLGWEKEYGY